MSTDHCHLQLACLLRPVILKIINIYNTTQYIMWLNRNSYLTYYINNSAPV